MSKIQRFLIVLAVMAVAFAFLWPTLSWYFFTNKADQALAVGSREQIREYARSMAVADLNQLKSLAAKNDQTPLAAGSFSSVIQAASKSYRDAHRSLPKTWTASTALAAFENERAAYDAIENVYRTAVMNLKAKHGKAIQLGLDLSGGMSVVIQADMDALGKKLGHTLSAAEKDDAMKRGIEVLNSRIDKFGLTEPVIRQQGEDQIYVEIPGAADPERINSIIMGKGNLAFYIVNDDATNKLNELLTNNPTAVDEKTLTVSDPNLVPAGYVIRKFYKKDNYGLDEFTGRYMIIAETPGLDGNHITSAQVSSDPITGQPETNFVLDKEGGDIFYKLTSANVGKTLAVVLDDRVKAGARIQEPIRDQVRMTGFTQDEAQNLALLLRTAALPVELSVVNQQAIGASLGEDAVHAGIFAVTIAFLLVIGFMLLYYKGAGINTAIAEIINLFIMVGVLSAFGLTLTLPSIAGFVLTIGVSVDANVLIFERIKEELRQGKGRVASIRAGFDKAFWTIFDSHLTNLIAALFLAQLGSGPIQGFAVSLAIGTICSLFTSLFVSHLIFDFETDVLKVKHTSISWRVK
ncbi:MAG TPA: protein translocase subunit SecD [Rectinemataceae bacterium]|nr:protein translocase subunit SecD [Rectinemataceae bacterium]